VFLLGACPEVVTRAAAQLPKLFPNITVVGFEYGYFTDEEEDAIVAKINASESDLLLVGMTTPKKEMLIKKHWAHLSVSMAFGIGGLVDIWGGKTREVPE
jgi:N-acetylglucosaminyldiphosphoundecaprenol N-acetyl-beta-D-mannosaminyltransferase